MADRFALPRLATAAAAAAWLLAGCASGPDYKPHSATLPAGYAQAPASVAADEAALAAFWQQFGDPVLDRLMQQARTANLDVRIARERLVEAQAVLLGTVADARPSLGVQADATRSVAPEWQQPGRSRSERTGSVFAPSVVMNWELDLFGRNRRSSESAAALVSAQELGIGGAQVALAGAVATNYLSLRGLQQRLAVAQESLANQREALRLTEVRVAAGRGTALEVARARNLVAGTAATVPALQTQVQRTVQRLATLVSQPAPFVAAEVATLLPLPRLPAAELAQWPVGTPAELLRRRPDIRAAERQLAASHADIGVAMADRFPRVSLSGLLGLNSNRLGELASGGAAVASLGASLSWSAFDFGRTDARVGAARSRTERSLLVYEQTVLTALEEAENALGGYTRQAEQAAELLQAANAAQQAADLARKRYAVGGIDQLALLDAERQLLGARDQLTQADTATATALVEVYRALGGGWQVGKP